jgi:predicted dehydrogenase
VKKIKKEINIGLIGCGNISKRHIESIKGTEGLELRAVCDNKVERANKIREEEGCDSYSNYLAMVQDPAIDVVSICTPNYLHASMSARALDFGKHVLCEKPMAITTKESERIIQAEEKSGKKFMLVKQNRFNPPIKALKNAVYNDQLGELHMINSNVYWNRTKEYYDNSDWKGKKLMDGGTLYTQVSHFLDLMLWIGGDVESVDSSMKNSTHPYIDIEDTGILRLKFENGIIGNLTYTTCALPKNMEGNLTVFGEKGTVKVGGQYLNTLDHWYVESVEEPKLEPSAPPNDYGYYQGSMSNHEKVYENLANVLLRNESIAANSLQGHESVKVMEAAYESSRQGIEIKLK